MGFHEIIHNLIKHIPNCENISDNIWLWSQDITEHLKQLNDLLQTIDRSGFTLKFAKCSFAVPEINVSGHIVSSRGIQPDKKKIEAVANAPAPKTKAEVSITQQNLEKQCRKLRRSIRSLSRRTANTYFHEHCRNPTTLKKSDPELIQVRQCIENNQPHKPPSHYKPLEQELSIVDDIILRDNRIILPAMLRNKAIKLAHEDHAGMTKTKQRIRSKLWWPTWTKILNNTSDHLILAKS